MAKMTHLTTADLPTCVPCAEADGNSVVAEYLAFIGIRVGRQEWQEWQLVCAKHKYKYAAYKLVKHVETKRRVV